MSSHIERVATALVPLALVPAQRVGHLGGTFRIASRPGAGTRIVVTVPAEPVETAKLASA